MVVNRENSVLPVLLGQIAPSRDRSIAICVTAGPAVNTSELALNTSTEVAVWISIPTMCESSTDATRQ